jgi:hypothetical protein
LVYGHGLSLRAFGLACPHLLVRERSVSRESVHHELEGRERQVELISVVLVDQPDARAGVAEDLARGWLQLAKQELDQSRLAVAVLAQQHNPGADEECALGVGCATGLGVQVAAHLDLASMPNSAPENSSSLAPL